MRAAFNAAHRSHTTGNPTTVSHVEQAADLGPVQAQNALSMAAQLRLVHETAPGTYQYIGAGDLRNSPREGLPQFFRAAAQRFAPFLFYVSFLAGGFSEQEAARQSTSIFGIGLDPGRVVRLFRRWNRYAGITDDQGNLDFTPPEILDLGFLNRLHEALRAELSAQTFVLTEMGSVAAGFYATGLNLDAIGRALVIHQQNPNDALRDVGSLVEQYLAQLSGPLGGPNALLVPMLDFLSGVGQRAILKTHKNLGYGITGFRNAADHGADQETGRPWNLTPEAALVGTLLALLTMKSIARYVRDGTQEV